MNDKSYYMHTLDGKPACFDGWQVCFGMNGRRVASSLKQIRREQHESTANRTAAGLQDHDTMGYVRFRLPMEDL